MCEQYGLERRKIESYGRAWRRPMSKDKLGKHKGKSVNIIIYVIIPRNKGYLYLLSLSLHVNSDCNCLNLVVGDKKQLRIISNFSSVTLQFSSIDNEVRIK
jgi:hypothetical protein